MADQLDSRPACEAIYSHAHHANTDVWGCPDSKLKLSEFAC
jgi:hypothetical protein